MRHLHSLVFKLIALAVCMVIAGSFLRYVMLEKTLKTGIEEVVNAQQLSLARYIAEDIDSKVLARQEWLQRMAADLAPQVLHNPQQLQAWLQEEAGKQSLFPQGLLLIPKPGPGAVARYPASGTTPVADYSGQDWFVAAAGGAPFAIGRPTLDGPSGQALLHMAVPLRNPQQEVVAVLAGVTALNAPGFLDLVQTGAVGKTGSLLLVSPRDQLFVTASDPAMRLQATPPPGTNPLHDQAMVNWSGTGVTRNARGVEELSAVARIPSANWFLVARTPTAEAFALVSRLMQAQVEASIKAGAGLMVVLVLLLGYLFKPLKQASAQMRAMARGNTALERLPVTRHDEIGDMVKSFNELVDKLQQSESRMRHLAHHDPLTGLPNRMAFQQSLGQCVALADRQRGSLGLLFIDLDGFKAVNDTFGHEVGDQVLQQVAQRLRDCVRTSDIVGRLGGDEFVVLLTDHPTAEGAALIARKIIAATESPFVLDPQRQAQIGASVGMAMYPQDAKTADALLLVADTAMYVSKRSGGRQCYHMQS